MKSIVRNLVLMFLVALLTVGHVTLVTGCKEKGAGTGERTEESEESWDESAEGTTGDTDEPTDDELSERAVESF